MEGCFVVYEKIKCMIIYQPFLNKKIPDKKSGKSKIYFRSTLFPSFLSKWREIQGHGAFCGAQYILH